MYTIYDLKVFSVSSVIISACVLLPSKASQEQPFLGDESLIFEEESSKPIQPYLPSSRLSIKDTFLEDASQISKNENSAKGSSFPTSTFDSSLDSTFFKSPGAMAVITSSNETQDSLQDQTSSKIVRRKSQKKKNSSSPRGATYSHRTRACVKPRIRELLQTINPFDSQGKFYSIEFISNIFQTEAMLFDRAFRPTPDELLHIIITDPKLKQLYEKTNINR